MNTVDYVIMGFVLIALIYGYFKGFIITLFSFLGYIAAVICAKLFSPAVTSFLKDNTFADKTISDFVNGKLGSLAAPANSGALTDFKIPENMETELTKNPELNKILTQNPILKNILDQDSISDYGQTVADVLANFLLTMLSAIAIFIVVKIVVGIIGNMINRRVKKSRTLNSANNLGGLFFSGLTGLIILFVVLTAISPFIFASGASGFTTAINDSLLTGIFYKSKLFSILMESGLSIG